MKMMFVPDPETSLQPVHAAKGIAAKGIGTELKNADAG